MPERSEPTMKIEDVDLSAVTLENLQERFFPIRHKLSREDQKIFDANTRRLQEERKRQKEERRRERLADIERRRPITHPRIRLDKAVTTYPLNFLEGIKDQYLVTADGKVWLRTKTQGLKPLDRDERGNVALFTNDNEKVIINADLLVCIAVHGPAPDPDMMASRRGPRDSAESRLPPEHSRFLSWRLPPPPPSPFDDYDDDY